MRHVQDKMLLSRQGTLENYVFWMVGVGPDKHVLRLNHLAIDSTPESAELKFIVRLVGAHWDCGVGREDSIHISGGGSAPFTSAWTGSVAPGKNIQAEERTPAGAASTDVFAVPDWVKSKAQVDLFVVALSMKPKCDYGIT